MNNLSEILAGAKEEGIEVKEYCSFNCTRSATGEIAIVDNGMEIALPICDPCAQKIMAKRTAKGLDTIMEK